MKKRVQESRGFLDNRLIWRRRMDLDDKSLSYSVEIEVDDIVESKIAKLTKEDYKALSTMVQDYIKKAHPDKKKDSSKPRLFLGNRPYILSERKEVV